MSEILFGRRVRVSIYKQGLTPQELQTALAEDNDPETNPIDNSQAENSGERSTGILEFTIDEELPLEFEVYKTLDNSGKSNNASLKINGISEQTAKAMGYQMLTCKIAVGYRGQPLVPIFLGDIISASYKRGNGKESSYAEFELSQSYLKLNAGVKFSSNFPRDTDLGQIMFALIEFFGIEIKFMTADTDTQSIIEKKITYGLSLEGTLNECLQKVLKPYGFKWNLNDANQVEVFKDDVYTNTEGRSGAIVGGKLKIEEATQSETKTSTGIQIFELDGDSGLIDQPYLETESITKRLPEVQVEVPIKNSKSGKTRKKTLKPKITVPRQIVNFKTLLLPEIQPKTVVKIVSKSQQNLSGLYGVLSVKYTGNTYGDEWYCECVGVSTEKRE